MKRHKSTNAYPDYFVDYVVEVYRQTGLAAAARITGMGTSTVKLWARRRGVVTEMGQTESLAKATVAAEEVRTKVREKLMHAALDLLERMNMPHVDFKGNGAQEVTYPLPSASSCQSYVTAVGILIDKYRLEMGETTGRSAVDITVTDEDRRKVEDDVAKVIAEAQGIAEQAAREVEQDSADATD
jgi:hypothetical protein